MVQFDLLPSPHPPPPPRDGELFEADLFRVQGGGANKKYILFAKYVPFLAQFTWHDGCRPQDYVFLRKNEGICRRVGGGE